VGPPIIASEVPLNTIGKDVSRRSAFVTYSRKGSISCCTSPRL